MVTDIKSQTFSLINAKACTLEIFINKKLKTKLNCTSIEIRATKKNISQEKRTRSNFLNDVDYEGECGFVY